MKHILLYMQKNATHHILTEKIFDIEIHRKTSK